MLPAFQKEDWATYEPLKKQYQDIIRTLDPIYIGPIFQRDEHGRFLLPERTLGWQIIEWCYEWLDSPQGGDLVLTDEQARLLLWWYAVDERGKFIYRGGVFQRLKGHGKDPLAAIMACIEFVGPSQFGGWDEHGNPIGVPHPAAWVQLAATAQEQTKNTGTLFPAIMSERMQAEYGIKLSSAAEIIRADNGRKRIEMITSNFRTMEGNRPTFAILNEPHHWLSNNGGIDMYDGLKRNLTKTGGRFLAITNAFMPGEDSVAERLRAAHDAVAAGLARDTGVLYDSIEAHPDVPLTPEALEIQLPMIAGDSWWVHEKIEGYIADAQDISTGPTKARRFYLNQVVAGDDALHSPKTWDPLARPGESLRPGDEIVLGFDGGRTDDATALVAIRTRDMFVEPIGVWQKPDHYSEGKWEVNREEVGSKVHWVFKTYKVRGMYCDVALWESYIADWERAYGSTVAVQASPHKPFEFDMRNRKKSTLAHERFLASIWDRKIRHPGESTPFGRLLRIHVLNVFRRDTPDGVSFGKQSRESPRKVDAYAATMLAHEALIDLRQRGEIKRERTGRVWAF